MATAAQSGRRAASTGRGRTQRRRRTVTAEAAAGAAAATTRGEVPDILRALGDEHRYQMRLLALLEKQVAVLNLKQQPDYAVMQGVMRYMTQYPDRFHHPKEDLVFEKVVQRDPSAAPQVQDLLDAHVKIIAQGGELLALIDRCRAEPEKADTYALRKSAHAYVGAMRRHMDAEMLRVFPRAQQVLREDDWIEVDARMKPILDPVFGSEVAPEFQTLRAQEERRPGSVRQGAARASLIEAAALIESMSTLIAGAARMNRRLARHNSEAMRVNAEFVNEMLKAPLLGRRLELAGQAWGRNFALARDVNRRLLDLWKETFRAARRPYEDDGPYAPRLFRPCRRPARSADGDAADDVTSTR